MCIVIVRIILTIEESSSNQITKKMVKVANCLNQHLKKSVHLKKPERFNPPCTDVLHLLGFGICLIIWFAIAVYAYSAGTPIKYEFSPFTQVNPNSIQVQISPLSLYQLSILSVSFTWFAASCLGLYYILALIDTKKMFLFGLIIVTFTISLILLNLIAYCDYGCIPIVAIIIIIYGFTLYTFKQAGLTALRTVVRQACLIVIRLPSTLMITVLTINLMLLIALVTISIVTNLITIHAGSEPSLWHSTPVGPPAHVIAIIMVFLSCSLWIITVIHNFAKIALYGIFVKWYNATDKDSISHTFIFRSMSTSFRYHFGTVVFSSTIFSIFTTLRATFNSRIELLSKFKDRPITIFCFLVLLANSTSNTLLACASNGTSFYRSTKDSFKLIMRNPLTFTATHIQTEWILFSGVYFIYVSPASFASSYLEKYNDYYLPFVPVLSTYIIGISSLWIALVFLVTFHAAMQTCLYCYLEDLHLSTPSKSLSDEDVGNVTVPGQA